MGKKIGILTFHNAINYGAVLQAVAMQSFIESETSASVEIIDLTTEDHLKGLNPVVLSSANPIKNLLLKLWNLKFVKSLKRRNSRFQDFKRTELHLSKRRFQNTLEISETSNHYDVMITGSDQVFHPKIKNSDAYYLHFDVKGARRVAYAPSFGLSDLSADEAKRIAAYLKEFDSLSCREEQGAHLISNLIGRRVPTVCDPVFLRGQEFWNRLASRREIDYVGDYIFMFDLNGGENLASISRRLSAETKIPVVCATFNILNSYRDFRKLYDLGPLEWLCWMKNAKYVVTDSFHGSAIGIIMNKPVLTYVAAPALSSRLTTLFGKLGICEQLIYNPLSFELSDIKFNDYKKNLEEFVSSSKKYLLDAINR